jgi:hypothetical protein
MWADVSKARHRLVVAPVACAAAGSLLLSFAARGADDRLACEFISPNVVREAFANRLTKVRRLLYAFSPTAPPPRNHTLRGADASLCHAQAWQSGPYPKGDLRSIGESFRVPPGVGVLSVRTYLRDGSEFDAAERYTNEIKGIHRVTVPSFGLTRSSGGWFINRNQFAAGVWQAGEEGIIVIEVFAHRDAVGSLRRAAPLIVPDFNPRVAIGSPRGRAGRASSGGSQLRRRFANIS